MDGDVVCRYDELELMQHLEDEDFEFMKITNKEHRKAILRHKGSAVASGVKEAGTPGGSGGAGSKAPEPEQGKADVATEASGAVGAWLAEIGMERYTSVFIENG